MRKLDKLIEDAHCVYIFYREKEENYEERKENAFAGCIQYGGH